MPTVHFMRTLEAYHPGQRSKIFRVEGHPDVSHIWVSFVPCVFDRGVPEAMVFSWDDEAEEPVSWWALACVRGEPDPVRAIRAAVERAGFEFPQVA